MIRMSLALDCGSLPRDQESVTTKTEGRVRGLRARAKGVARQLKQAQEICSAARKPAGRIPEPHGRAVERGAFWKASPHLEAPDHDSAAQATVGAIGLRNLARVSDEPESLAGQHRLIVDRLHGLSSSRFDPPTPAKRGGIGASV